MGHEYTARPSPTAAGEGLGEGAALGCGEGRLDLAEANLITIFDRRGRLGRQLLPIQIRRVGAVQLLDELLGALRIDLRMHTRDALLLALVRREIYVGIDVAHGVFAAYQKL